MIPQGTTIAIVDVRARRDARQLSTREYEVLWHNGRSGRALEGEREWVAANELKTWPARVGHVAALALFLGAAEHIDVVEELQKLIALTKRCVTPVAGAQNLEMAQLRISEIGPLLGLLLVAHAPVPHALSPLHAAASDALRQLQWLCTEIEGAADAPVIIVAAVTPVAQRWGVDVSTPAERERRDASAEPAAKKARRGGDGRGAATGAAAADAGDESLSSLDESIEPMTQAPDQPDYIGNSVVTTKGAARLPRAAPAAIASATMSTGLDMESVCGHHSNRLMTEEERRGSVRDQYEYMRHAVTRKSHSHGRCFTKTEILRQIAAKLRPFLTEGRPDRTEREDEIFIDFSCGANEFAPMLFDLEYVCFDILPPRNNDNFLQKSWFDVTPTSRTCSKCARKFADKPPPAPGAAPGGRPAPHARVGGKEGEMCTGRAVLDVPEHATSVIGINPPFGPAQRFINGALAFKPRLLVLIIPCVHRVSLRALHPRARCIPAHNLSPPLPPSLQCLLRRRTHRYGFKRMLPPEAEYEIVLEDRVLVNGRGVYYIPGEHGQDPNPSNEPTLWILRRRENRSG